MKLSTVVLLLKNNILVLASTFSMIVAADLVEIDESDLDAVAGQAGITLNAKIVLGAESSFVYTNTSGATLAEVEAAKNTPDPGDDIDVSYLIIDGIEGSVEIEGLKLDLISDLNSSGKPALQWTLPEKITVNQLKTSGIYASSTEKVDANSTFLLSANLNGALTLPADTTISIFVVD